MTAITPLILAAAIIVLLWVGSAWNVFLARSGERRQAVIFFFLVFSAMLALRWPHITWRHEINADESQMLAQGMRFLRHPVPWRDVDGMTGGPLDSQLLTSVMALGIPGSWAMARMVLWAINCGTILFLYLALRRFGTRTEAQFAVLPVILFYAFAAYPDFIHYASETLPGLLISAALWLLTEEWFAPRSSKARMLGLGLICGAIPFAKLQAGPVAAFLAMAGMAQLARRRGLPRDNPWKAMGVLCTGFLAMPAVILGIVAAFDAWEVFWKSYIMTSMVYVEQEGFWTKEINLERVLMATKDFKALFLCAIAPLALLPIVWLARRTKLAGTIFWPWLTALVLVVVTLSCLLAAGKDYYHYVLLLVPGLGILFGLSFLAGRRMSGCDEFSVSSSKCSVPERSNTYSLVVKGWVVVFILLTGMMLTTVGENYRKDFLAFRATVQQWGAPKRSLVSERVRSVSRPGDTLAVWGWMPAYHVETGIPPAARAVIGDRLITKLPLQNYFRSNFVADLQHSRPALFVDAIAGNTFEWYWINPGKHESFPVLGKFIADNYILWLSIQMTNAERAGEPIRIYVLKERAAELGLKPENMKAAADPFYVSP